MPLSWPWFFHMLSGFYICDPYLPLSYLESVTGICQDEAVCRAWWEGPAGGFLGVATACPHPDIFRYPHFLGP